MREQVLAHLTAASGTDWFARWIAIAGLITSIGTVVVTVVLWNRQGWVLDVRHTYELTENYIDDPRQDPDLAPKQIRIRWHIYSVRITNVGRQACVVSDAGLIFVSRDEQREQVSREWFRASEGLPVTIAPSETVTLRCHRLPVHNRRVEPPLFAIIQAFAITAMRTYTTPMSRRDAKLVGTVSRRNAKLADARTQ